MQLYLGYRDISKEENSRKNKETKSRDSAD
jgi:hypothetical protein